ncbi:hypothetical protein GS937_08145 [Rhodococcus hoagii]|nr:hypothetical protein [Prescottella equi]MBM4515511.1 hypothetical protein [Prescottella equi]NKV81436.1 hypothetical protein [Prescottella equi]NKW64326.1 hypothetical protein [Prescottella equi]NKZ73851.1 hypothetical protein [Prescottella equi]
MTKLIDAASGEESIATVVRKLYVLARRAGAADLEAWAVKELNGYEASDPLPTYRGPIPVNPLGLFIDGFGGKIKNVAMPSMHVPEEVRERLYTVRLYEPLVALEVMASEDRRVRWDANWVLGFNQLVAAGLAQQNPAAQYVLESAEYFLLSSQLKGILDSIRFKALDLALTLEKSVPDAGEPGVSDETNQKVVAIINQHWDLSGATFSGSHNVFGSSNVEQNVTVTQGNDSQLHSALGSAGVASEDIARLFEALEKNGGDVEEARSWFDSIKENLPVKALPLVAGILGLFFGVPPFAG